MGGLELALFAAALLVGATGTWSPCGFSMVETIGPTGHTGGRRTTLAACATFLPGALAGALATFAGLALLGSLVPGDGWLRYAIAAAVAVAAAIAEARGTRLAPQIRRQLPEHWRRLMPMPLAAALYGVLLGLGFTTFVLTFGVWALAGISLALGAPAAGLAIGLGFGVGRALPIIALAPIADKPAGRSAIALMAERPGLYRGIRLGDAAALAGVAVALTGAGVAQAEVTRAKPAADPSVQGEFLVTQRGNDPAGQLHGPNGETTALPGAHPAIGGPYIAVAAGGSVVLLDRFDLDEIDRTGARGADAIAVSRKWLAVRTRVKRTDRIRLFRLGKNGTIRRSKVIAKAKPPAQLGRPSLGGDRLAFATAKKTRNRIVVYQMKKGKRKTVIGSVRYGLSNPALRGKKLAYVRTTRKRDQLRLRKLGARGDKVLKAGKARLWSTALTGKRAYFTVIAGRKAHSRVASLKR